MLTTILIFGISFYSFNRESTSLRCVIKVVGRHRENKRNNIECRYMSDKKKFTFINRLCF